MCCTVLPQLWTRDYPIVVVATSSNPGDIPVSVAMEFLHTIRLTTPTEAERLAMLQALSRDYLLAPAIPWNHFARQTAVSFFHSDNYNSLDTL